MTNTSIARVAFVAIAFLSTMASVSAAEPMGLAFADAQRAFAGIAPAAVAQSVETLSPYTQSPPMPEYVEPPLAEPEPKEPAAEGELPELWTPGFISASTRGAMPGPLPEPALPAALLPRAASAVATTSTTSGAVATATKAVSATASSGTASKSTTSGATASSGAAKSSTATGAATTSAAAGEGAAKDSSSGASASTGSQATATRAEKLQVAPTASTASAGAPASLSGDATAIRQVERVPSRRVEVEAGQRVDLAFSGTGWIYLGDVALSDGIMFSGKRFESVNAVFTLEAKKPGDYLLWFQKQDSFSGVVYDEYVLVTVRARGDGTTSSTVAKGGASGAATGATSGAGAAAVPESSSAKAATQGAASGASSLGASAATAGASTSAAGTSGSLEAVEAARVAPSAIPESPEGILLAAKNELQAGRVPSAMALLDAYVVRYPAGCDELYWLYGVAFEQSGPFRDIKKAYAFYKKLVEDYPMSPWWEKAKERMTYIERHYLQLR
jgi:hypothetical protein